MAGAERPRPTLARRFATPAALWRDAVAFGQAFRDGAGARARTLYGGELLPGFYDEWLVDERQRLRALFDRLDAETRRGTPRFDGALYVSLVDARTRTDVFDRLQLALRIDGGSVAVEQLLATLSGARC